MYSYGDKVKAIELYMKYDKKESIVIRELGYHYQSNSRK